MRKLYIILAILCINNVFHAAYRSNTLKFVPKINMPKVFKKYRTPTPLSHVQVTSLLQQKSITTQNAITKHPFYKDFIDEVSKPPIIDYTLTYQPIYNKDFMIKQEVFMYCLEHPENSQDIMDFYQEMKEAQTLIQDKLKSLPPHIQEFFKKEVEKYLNSDTEYNQTSHINQVKEKILRLFPYVIDALFFSFYILAFTVYMLYILTQETTKALNAAGIVQLDTQNPQERELLEAFNLLTNSLYLDPIPLYKVKEDSSQFPSYVPASHAAFIKLIILNSTFFKLNLDSQIFILLHELRHAQQHTQIYIPKEVIREAVAHNVNPFDLSFMNFLKSGFFFSTDIMEFDADLSAAKHMKNYPQIKSITKDLGRSSYYFPIQGYLSESLITEIPKSPHHHQIDPFVEKKWNKFIQSLPNDNMYLKYIPKHLHEAAAQNKDYQERKASKLKEAQQIFKDFQAY